MVVSTGCIAGVGTDIVHVVPLTRLFQIWHVKREGFKSAADSKVLMAMVKSTTTPTIKAAKGGVKVKREVDESDESAQKSRKKSRK